MRPDARQVVVILGTPGGVCGAVAMALARRGATVVLGRPGEAGDLGRRPADHFPGSILSINTDANDPQQVEALAAATVSRFGRIDTWINDTLASGASVNPTPRQAAVAAVIQTDIHGTHLGTRAALAVMRSRNAGIVINVGVPSSDTPPALAAAYATAKQAVRGFTEGVQRDLRRAGSRVRVTLVTDAGHYGSGLPSADGPRVLPSRWSLVKAIVAATGQAEGRPAVRAIDPVQLGIKAAFYTLALGIGWVTLWSYAHARRRRMA